MNYNLIIEIVGAVIGLAYLYFEYKASYWMWRVGLFMNLFYIYIFYHSGFYADAAIYIYYLAANIYGRISWGRDRKAEKPKLPISHLRSKEILPLIVCWFLTNILIYFVLVKFTDSVVPIGDSFTTALSMVGMWMVAKKRVEVWWVWFVVNAVSMSLYLWKGLYPTAMLYVFYVVVSVMGYYKWRKMMNESIRLQKI
ncbi:MAG: nicotinamide riboside transporter PnuC [Bacteroidales bacterium]|nr:nicotinamide riboside transporter PnuC [Bacteroidales bacterium]